MDKSTITIIICGKGGSGTKYMSIILARAAIKSGFDAKLLMSYGPEVREGDVRTYITISQKRVANPVIRNADYLVSFDDSCTETFTHRYDNIIKAESNMTVLGILTRLLNMDLNIVIDTMKEETGKRHEEMVPLNIANISGGYHK